MEHRATTHLLVIEAQADLRAQCSLQLGHEGLHVHTAADWPSAQSLLAQQPPDLLLLDLDPLGDDLAPLRSARSRWPQLPIVASSQHSQPADVVRALQHGATDFAPKPWHLPSLGTQLARLLRAAAPGMPASIAGSGQPHTPHEALQRLTGDSPAMQALRHRIQKVAASLAPVLITGESGTGKELVARALHACSPRAQAPWVAVNCGAIPEDLLEAEFFGACKGAYTGAHADRQGFFSAAQGGTLFLDEVGELPLPMQAKLLRALQERCIRPLGATDEVPVDVRIVCATHRDLHAEVAHGRFRQDVFYRLNVIDIHVPPLRERRQDLPALCDSLLQRLTGRRPEPGWSDTLLEQIATASLPGNVRELENLLHRQLTLGDGLPAPPSPSAPTDASTRASDSLPPDLMRWLDQQERELLVRALQANHYNRTAAAQCLGLSLRQMRYRIARLNIAMHLDHRAPDAAPSSDNREHDAAL